MGYEMSVHAQDPSSGRVRVVLDALTDASVRAGDYEFVDIAVAYASIKGVGLLDAALSNGPWSAARKRFLVSMDFGFTQPQALVCLSELENAEVRVPNGRAVLASPTLRPPSAFHAKTFVFRNGEGHPFVRALVVGSANLTASALSTGAEVITKQIWSGASFSAESWNHRKFVEPVLDWFNDTWQGADPLSDVLDNYRSRHRSLPKPRIPPEERTPTTRSYLASPADAVISGTLPVQLAAARALWIHGTSIIRNRDPRPGNQLNTRKGTRVFFGFSAEHVPKDTTLGSVQIRVEGHPYIERSVRFANNGMDIVGLPIPEQNGLESYQDLFLVFTRELLSASGQGQFTLTATDETGLTALKDSAANSVDLTMNGGRQYGLLF
jgi:HKD family nuclease